MGFYRDRQRDYKSRRTKLQMSRKFSIEIYFITFLSHNWIEQIVISSIIKNIANINIVKYNLFITYFM